MRIITGIYKGRRFDIPHTFKARPTTDFAKENIFNVLNSYIDFEGAMALDLFAGTGSISLELLSRGCQQVVSIEKDRNHHAFIRQCVQKLGADNSVVIRGDVFRYIKSCSQQFDFIFADPPYQLTELAQIPDLIFEKDLLKEEGIFVLEHGAQNDFSNHPHFVEHRKYGSVNFSIFQ
ncbi:MAG: 16S rRNA (guanine(966)-N(2))-methyltransferase RsmD [Prevotella sp.]|nr:16S rRNA (guanine(966)-N(2))-methyltransferase RsmD [Prevotella sp.]